MGWFKKFVKAVTSIPKTVEKTVQAVVNNPLPVIETVALTSIGVPAPVASATVAAANGASTENIAKAAIASYTGSEVGASTGTAVASATDNAVLANIAGSAAGNAASTLVKGGNLDQAFANAVIGASGSAAQSALTGTPTAPAPQQNIIPDKTTQEISAGAEFTPPSYTLAPGQGGPGLKAGTLTPAELGKADYGFSFTDLPSEGLKMPTSPNVESMGGAQGLTAKVPGGTVSETGLTATGTLPALGDPQSFINKPAPGGDINIPEPPSGSSYQPSLFPYSPVTRQLGQRGGLGTALGLDVGGVSPLTTTGLTAARGAGEIESSETGGKRQNVWNEASLRLKDALGL